MGEVRSPVRGWVTVEPRKDGRVFVAAWVRADGTRTRRVLGPAWVRDSGKRTARGATVWRAASGSKPDDTYLTPRDAEDRLQAILTDERGQPAAKVRRSRGKTWGDALDGWLHRVEHVRGIEDTTLNSYRSIGRQLEREGLPRDLPIRQVTALKLESVQDGLLARIDDSLPRRPSKDQPVSRLSRKTIANRMQSVGAIVGYARRQGWITRDVMADIEVVRPPKASATFHVLEPSTLEQVARAIETAEPDIEPNRNGKVDGYRIREWEANHRMWAEMVRIAAYTGMRAGELRAMRWEQIDWVGETVRVTDNLPTSAPAGAKVRAPKSGHGRAVPMIPQAATVLERVSKFGHPTGPGDLVFPNLAGGMQDDGKVRDAFYDGLRAAGVGHLREVAEPIVFHDLRHTFGTIAVRIFPVNDVKEFMGHADIKTTMRYVHYVPRRDAARKLGEAFASDLNPLPATAAGEAPAPA